jgi:hypothetical protein
MFEHRAEYYKEYDDWPDSVTYHDCLWWREAELNEKDLSVEDH